jgi:malate synthase
MDQISSHDQTSINPSIDEVPHSDKFVPVAPVLDGPYVAVGGLQVNVVLARLVEEEICPGTGFTPGYFWKSLHRLVQELGPEVHRCLARRDDLQAQINAFYEAQRASGHDVSDERHLHTCHKLLQEIGYLVPDGGPLSVTTDFVDPEIAQIPAPQLVVPSDNSRYVLNAINARWGSLFDAIYSFDVIPETKVLSSDHKKEYNPIRGKQVIQFSNSLLDEISPLVNGSWSDAARIWPRFVGTKEQLVVLLACGDMAGLKYPSQYTGSTGSLGPPQGHASPLARERILADAGRIFLKHNGLHIILEIDHADPVGGSNPSGIKDIIMESALTAIIDMEDSVAAVDANDKARIYANVNGIFRGKLSAPFMKNGAAVTRQMNKDIRFRDDEGKATIVPGRAICLVRNVGHHMFTDSVLNAAGKPIPEGFLDCFITVASAIHDLKGTSEFCNSRAGSIYIVKPKMHGPEEVALTNRLFGLTEELFGLRRNTIKMGIMDEERRTSVNLRECIRAASARVFFINTGFLDRTGDEIHTCMCAGAVVPKTIMKQQAWIKAYEAHNVDVGIASGMLGRAQIGKGMWPKPDSMKAMLDTKIGELMSGASTAWVPSPLAATLHAIHYHRVDVMDRQAQLAMRPPSKVDDILVPPLLKGSLSKEAIDHELRENVQSILGYVVRWVDLGVGCSKVPDLSNIGLMEDRATLRISSQLLANWLADDLITEYQLLGTFETMAAVVDQQNANQRGYQRMAGNLDNNIAFQAALKLVFDGCNAPNGYTESCLHDARRKAKAAKQSRL